MKWIGEHIWDLTSRFRNTISIGKDSSFLTNIDQSTNDISTWQLQPESFAVSTQEATPEAVFFKPDGTKMYILGRSGDDVGEYALSTAWDISTATYTDALTGLGSSPTSESNPYGMYISPDGIYLYITGHSVDEVAQYTMSTAWDISTASYTREQDLTDAGGTFSNPTGIHFKPDGTMFWACSYDEDSIQQYTLSTAWDVSTLSVGHSFSLIDFFILNDFSGTANADLGSVEDLFFSEDGTKVWLVENAYDSVHQLKLSTAWDIRTAAYDGRGIRHTAFESVVEGIYVNETAGKAFTVSSSSDRVRSFNLGGAVFSSANDANIGFEGGIGVKGNSSFSGTTSFADVTAQSSYVYGTFTTNSTTNLAHGNGGSVNILDGSVYSGDAIFDVMTNVLWGANGSDQSVQDNYQHHINLGRPKSGAKVTLNIGRKVDGGGNIWNHEGVVDIVSMAQTFDHYGSLDVGRTLQVDGKADLEVFDLGGTVVFNDTFTETNTTAIESHTPDLGAGWTKVFDTGSTTTFNIIGGAGYGQLSNTESSDGVMFLADTTPTGVDYEVRVDFKRRDSGDDVFHIIIKYQDANNYYALQWSTSYSTYCTLYRVESGTVVKIDNGFQNGVMNSTSDNLSTALKLRFIDNTLMIWDIDSSDNKAFRGSYPVTTDFNDGNGGTYHKVGMAFGDLFGGGLDATTTWKVDKFEVKMLSSAATFAAATKSYVDAGNFGVGITNPTSKFHVVGDARIQGNLTVNGTYTQIDTDVNTTEQWLVTNDGTGPAAVINQLGSQDIFDVQDDGTSVFYIEDGGNIGIGTTNPDNLLHIHASGNGDKALIVEDDVRRIEIGRDQIAAKSADGATVQNLYINPSGNTAFATNSGNVGIGTTSPSYKLEVNGTGSFFGNIRSGGGTLWSDSNGGVQLGYNSSDATGYLTTYYDSTSVVIGAGISQKTGITINGQSASAGNQITFRVGNAERMRINSSGNVGIGTTSPSHKLDVDGGAQFNTNTGSTPFYITRQGGLGEALSIKVMDDNIRFESIQDESNDNYGGFDFRMDGGTTEPYFVIRKNADDPILHVDGGGNVGIGTTSPNEKLTIEQTSAGADVYPLQLSNVSTTDSTGVGIVFNVSSNTAYPNARILVERTDSDATGEMSFWTVSGNSGAISERMRIDKDGNVGIGTASPAVKLDVVGDAQLQGTAPRFVMKETGSNKDFSLRVQTDGRLSVLNDNLGSEVLVIKQNGKVGIGTTNPLQELQVDGSIYANGGDLYVNNGKALISVGDLLFKTFESGAYHERARILANGNVGIGTSSPVAKLHVYGDASAGWDRHIHLDYNGTDEGAILTDSEGMKFRNLTSGNNFYFRNSGNGTSMIITDSHDVGIGTISPSAKLEVAASGTTSQEIAHFGNSNGVGKIKMQLDGVGSSKQVMLDASNNEDIVLNTQGDSYFNAGNVGIGTTSPNALLDVDNKIYLQNDGTVKWGNSANAGHLTWSTNQAIVKGLSGQALLLGSNNTSARMTIDTSGNVGIGTTSPQADLQVGSVTTSFYSLSTGKADFIDTDKVLSETQMGTLNVTSNSKNAGDNSNLGPSITFSQNVSQYVDGYEKVIGGIKSYITTSGNTGENSSLGFYTHNGSSLSEKLTIDSSGNVGIGTTSPNGKLSITNDSTNTYAFRITSSDGGDLGGIYEDGGTNAELYLKNSIGTSNVLINSSGSSYLNGGNVGIGTSSPTEKLHVNGNGLFNGGLTVGDSAADTFITRGHTYLATTGNNVGIGTTSPDTKLHVDGDLTISGTAPTLRIQDSRNLNNPDWDSVSLGNIEFYTSDTTSPGARVLAEIEAFSNNAAASGPNADLIFKTSTISDSSPQTRLTIGYDGTSTFAGNVTAGSNSLTAGSLDINGDADISGNLTGVDTLTAANLIGTPADASTNSLTLGRTDNSNYWYVNHAGNDFRLYNPASSGSDILFGVNSGGIVQANNVGIGTATPTEKLEVNGNIAVSGTVDGVDIGANYANWNTAYSWGNHASAGYLTSSSTQSKYLRSDETDYFTGKLNWDGADYTDGINMSLGNIRDAHRIDANEFFQGASGRVRNNLGDPTVTEMALFEEQFKPQTTLANDYDDLTDLTFWYQETSSSSWVEDTSYSDDQKRKFLRTNNSSVIIPNLYYKFRVEFNAKSYTFANAMYMYWSSQSHNTQVHVWKKRCSDGTWIQHTSSTNTISSWPGHGYLPFSTIAWHETNTTSTSHYTHIRFEFTPNWSGHATYGDRPILLYGMQIWGGYPSGRRTPHYYDQNGEFNFLKDAHILDSNKLNVGTGNDLQIYHDGSNSYIDDAGTGNLKIRSNRLQLEKYTGETMAEFIADGASSLYYDNNKKLETTSTGVEVTGDVVISSDSFLKTSNNNLNFIELYNGSDASMRFRMGHATVGRFQFLNNSDTEVFTIDARNEKVGIGTTSPSEKLEVNGNIKIGDSDILKIGTSDDLTLTHDGTDSYVTNETGHLYIRNNSDDKDVIFQSDDGAGGVQTYFYLDGSQEFIVVNDNIQFCVGSSQDVRLYHDGSNASFKNYTGNFSIEALTNSGDMILTQFGDDRDIIFRCDDGSGGTTEYFRVDGGDEKVVFSKSARFADNTSAFFGDAGDLNIYHNGTYSNIVNATGNLYIDNNQDDGDIIFRSDDGVGGKTEYFRVDGGTERTIFKQNTSHDDGVMALFGNDLDLRVYHDGTDSFIKSDGTGNLYLQQLNDDKDIVFQSDNGSGGLSTYFFLDGSNSHTNFQLNARWVDNAQAQFGNSGDLLVYHDGSDSYIKDAGTGNLKVMANNLYLQNAIGENYINCYSDDRVEIFHNNVKKLETTSTGVDVTGNISLTGSVQKQIQVFPMNFVDDLGTDKHFMPFVTNTEQTVNYQEEAAMVMPADGRVVSVTVHYAQMDGTDGNITVGIETSACGQSYANPWTVEETETIAASVTDDHHVFHFAFDNAKHFESTDKMAISIQQSTDMQSAARFFWVTAVIEYDWSTFLGGTSAEYTTTP